MYGHVCMFVTCMHEHTIWLEDIPGLHLGHPQMPYGCIRGRKLSITGILHSVCQISPYPECSHITRTSPDGCCHVML